MKNPVFLFVSVLGALAEPAGAAPSWIWSSADPKPDESVDFRRTFEAPPEVRSATVTVACDNAARIFINGREAGQCTDWQTPVRFPVHRLLKPGSNEERAGIVGQPRHRSGRPCGLW
jgi:hypothetical protein